RGTTSQSARVLEPDLERVREALVAQLDRLYDAREEGWGAPQKYPFAGPVEHALVRARLAPVEPEREVRALRTLAQHARLIDPIWGGMYQYSEGGVWDRPHHEKIAAVQAGAIDTFALAYLRTGDPRWLAHARDVVRYLRDRLRAPEGAFYASQDADAPDLVGAAFYARDDEARRAVRAPRVDAHVYASSNGQLVAALARLSIATTARSADDDDMLSTATAAAERVIATHLGADGLFAHGEEDGGVRHLADQAEMLRAMLALYEASGDRRWVARARSLADALLATLRAPAGGLFARTEDASLEGALAERRVPVAENAIVARALLALARLVEDARYHDEAIAALRAVASMPALRALGRKVGEYAIALELALREHVVVHVVGSPDDPRTDALRRAALAWDDPRRLVETAAPGQGRYPYPGEPAAFLCGASSCSLPISDPALLAQAGDAF
ncbi:MAG: AGE family epimerase/isomerase, partial [Myxococcota bacterium]|nr:AGE family epimerase/isomerase [Myxococcota bacterium]